MTNTRRRYFAEIKDNSWAITWHDDECIVARLVDQVYHCLDLEARTMDDCNCSSRKRRECGMISGVRKHQLFTSKKRKSGRIDNAWNVISRERLGMAGGYQRT